MFAVDCGPTMGISLDIRYSPCLFGKFNFRILKQSDIYDYYWWGGGVGSGRVGSGKGLVLLSLRLYPLMHTPPMLIKRLSVNLMRMLGIIAF